MNSIVQYTKLQLKQRFTASPIKSLILYLSPVVILAINYALSKGMDLEKDGKKIIDKEFIYTSMVAMILYVVMSFSLAYEMICDKQKFRKQHIHSWGFGLFKYCISWEIIYAILILISSAIIIGALHLMGFLTNINIVISFLNFYFFQLYVVCLSVWVSSFFPKLPVIGGCVAVLLQLSSILSYFIYIYFKNYKENREDDNILKHGSNSNYISRDLYLVRKAKKAGETINFTNIFDSRYIKIFEDTSTSFGAVLLLILMAVFVDYFILSVHIVRGLPDRKNKSYFIQLIENKYRNNDAVTGDSNVIITKPNTSNPIAISIQHLFKQYSNNIMAVSNAYFDIHENEIFAITGPKNSGKSTLMKMLYGRLSSSYGMINYNVGGKMNDIRYRTWRSISRHISVAPKEDYVLMEGLSVSDHINLYKSMAQGEDGYALLKELNFTGKTSDRVNKLTDVEKTKVKIALAFLKNEKFVFLEEPTAGMSEKDVISFWEAVKVRAPHRAIVISTENMDEATQYANRILILKDGQIQPPEESEWSEIQRSNTTSPSAPPPSYDELSIHIEK